MKYILKYNVRSKYFHFTRELQKEFDGAIELYTFIQENNIKNYTLYKEINDTLNDKRIIKAIEYIENNMKIINKEQTKGTRLQIGTFMWDIDKILDILKGSDKE